MRREAELTSCVTLAEEKGRESEGKERGEKGQRRVEEKGNDFSRGESLSEGERTSE